MFVASSHILLSWRFLLLLYTRCKCITDFRFHGLRCQTIGMSSLSTLKLRHILIEFTKRFNALRCLIHDSVQQRAHTACFRPFSLAYVCCIYDKRAVIQHCTFHFGTTSCRCFCTGWWWWWWQFSALICWVGLTAPWMIGRWLLNRCQIATRCDNTVLIATQTTNKLLGGQLSINNMKAATTTNGPVPRCPIALPPGWLTMLRGWHWHKMMVLRTWFLSNLTILPGWLWSNIIMLHHHLLTGNWVITQHFNAINDNNLTQIFKFAAQLWYISSTAFITTLQCLKLHLIQRLNPTNCHLWTTMQVQSPSSTTRITLPD